MTLNKDTLPYFNEYTYVYGYDPSIMGLVHPAEKWVPSINKAVLRACALYAASHSGISLGGLKWFPCVQAC